MCRRTGRASLHCGSRLVMLCSATAEWAVQPRSIDDVLAEARRGLDRVAPADLAA
jgi:hypothetical protein